jgi:SAM-dependent methyltransferase
MGILGSLHGRVVYGRRVEVLARHLSHPSVIPRRSTVVDVGCGDGQLTAMIGRQRPDSEFSGLDVLRRPKTAVPVQLFDGSTIPLGNKSADVVLFVDVLHHTNDPMVLLREARRVARRAIVIKDHTMDGFLAGPTLRFMDRIGNARHGVALPYNYWTSEQWDRAIRELGLRVAIWKKDLGLYPKPAQWLFERSLHFIGVLAEEAEEEVSVL